MYEGTMLVYIQICEEKTLSLAGFEPETTTVSDTWIRWHTNVPSFFYDENIVSSIHRLL